MGQAATCLVAMRDRMPVDAEEDLHGHQLTGRPAAIQRNRCTLVPITPYGAVPTSQEQGDPQ